MEANIMKIALLIIEVCKYIFSFLPTLSLMKK
jgi:hypothetical protein